MTVPVDRGVVWRATPPSTESDASAAVKMSQGQNSCRVLTSPALSPGWRKERRQEDPLRVGTMLGSVRCAGCMPVRAHTMNTGLFWRYGMVCRLLVSQYDLRPRCPSPSSCLALSSRLSLRASPSVHPSVHHAAPPAAGAVVVREQTCRWCPPPRIVHAEAGPTDSWTGLWVSLGRVPNNVVLIPTENQFACRTQVAPPYGRQGPQTILLKTFEPRQSPLLRT